MDGPPSSDCPRCGYDLSGAVERFGRVRCPECGERFLPQQVGAFAPFPPVGLALAATCWPQLLAAPLTMAAPGGAQILALGASLWLLSRLYARRRRPESVLGRVWVLAPLVVLINGALGAGTLVVWSRLAGAGVIPW